ncbi:hypothetical protein, partial [Nocardia abscessus]|uniref:hypothetical protein n=1 Tax=Nocardia abscessus TaxID=120957 RepID=UPI002455BE5E
MTGIPRAGRAAGAACPFAAGASSVGCGRGAAIAPTGERRPGPTSTPSGCGCCTSTGRLNRKPTDSSLR